MDERPQVEQSPSLAQFGNVVPDGYSYYLKLVTPGEDLALPQAYFKWYDIRPPEVPITPAQAAEARATVAAEAARLGLEKELGFVLLHRAEAWLLLMMITWRRTNEIWESVYAKEAEDAGPYRPVTFEQSHRAAFCVWELAPIWHERNAWTRFLSSPRDEAAKLAYINDRFSGLA